MRRAVSRQGVAGFSGSSCAHNQAAQIASESARWLSFFACARMLLASGVGDLLGSSAATAWLFHPFVMVASLKGAKFGSTRRALSARVPAPVDAILISSWFGPFLSAMGQAWEIGRAHV